MATTAATGAATPAVLAMDTSSTFISAAIQAGDNSGYASVDAGRDTGALLPGLITEALRSAECTIADIDVVAVGVGPAPYTSLRVGVMFARALATALGIPVVGACSLDITARAAGLKEPFTVLADARRKEVYWATYDEAGDRTAGPQVAARSWIQDHIDLPMVTEVPRADVLATWVMSYGRDGLAHLGEFVGQWAAAREDAAEVEVPDGLLTPEPLYLRRPDVVEPATPTR